MKFKTTITIPICSVLMLACVKVSDKKTDAHDSETEHVETLPVEPIFEYQELVHLSGLIENNTLGTPDKSFSIKAKKIVVDDGAILRSHGASILIEAEEIEAQNWTIETFSPEENLKNLQIGVPGQNSGKIEIRVSKAATGSWQINPRGQAGGAGARGLNAIEVPGYIAPAAGSEGAPSSGFLLDNQAAIVGIIPICGVQAGAGGNGEAGRDGFSGQDGSDGGDSGQVEVVLPRDSSVKIIVNRIPGAAGSGGIGGAGGPGGAAGPGGSATRIEGRDICPVGLAGQVGAAGHKGQDGKAGSPGKQENACIQRGEARLCSDQLN